MALGPFICPSCYGARGRYRCGLDGGNRSGAKPRLEWWWWVESVVEIGLSDGGRSYAGAWTVMVSGCGLRGSAAGSCGVVEWSGGVLLHSLFADDFGKASTDIRDDSARRRAALTREWV